MAQSIENDSLDFLKNKQNNWPCWPVCPVKRYVKQGDRPECGIVYAGESNVFLANMFSINSLENVPKKEYASFEELVQDGWQVD